MRMQMSHAKKNIFAAYVGAMLFFCGFVYFKADHVYISLNWPGLELLCYVWGPEVGGIAHLQSGRQRPRRCTCCVFTCSAKFSIFHCMASLYRNAGMRCGTVYRFSQIAQPGGAAALRELRSLCTINARPSRLCHWEQAASVCLLFGVAARGGVGGVFGMLNARLVPTNQRCSRAFGCLLSAGRHLCLVREPLFSLPANGAPAARQPPNLWRQLTECSRDAEFENSPRKVVRVRPLAEAGRSRKPTSAGGETALLLLVGSTPRPKHPDISH